MTVRLAVLTISDSGARGLRHDSSGDAIVAWAEGLGALVVERAVVADDRVVIAAQLSRWADEDFAHVVITTGGTGLGPRDITPEATRSVIEREATGLAEALRASGMKQTPRAALSRGVAGTRGDTLIVNLPGSTAAVVDGLNVLAPLLEHIAALLQGKTEH
ncbi:MAG TPA: MogA/MoaB family molybdenum cofactor biosynthesis protein [Gemmatimonadales bacterium]|jgi:molybdenum cofactor synthesis domain-containing protein